MSSSCPERMLEYYAVAQKAYSNWGRDLKRPGLYALHSGYSPDGQSLPHYEDIAEYNSQLIRYANIANGQYVLDAGCGTGVLAYEIADSYPGAQIIGINIAEFQLKNAEETRRNLGIPNINFAVQDYMETAFTDHLFDRIIYCESFSHATDKKQLLLEAKRLLRGNGKVVIADCFISGSGLTADQLSQIRQVEEGFRLAPLSTIDEVLSMLTSTDFKGISDVDVTKNILPSAINIGQNALMRLGEAISVPEILKVSRYGCVALWRLFENRGLVYHFVSAVNS
ncbi:MAG: class I SAM-dependent methyltransferase [Armatimonadetes bacterium]|nr:MAG: class I SAM-dependent methyltransferase [Armatimonadota bacterium]